MSEFINIDKHDSYQDDCLALNPLIIQNLIQIPKDCNLKVGNNLSEFKTETQKRLVRENLGIENIFTLKDKDALDNVIVDVNNQQSINEKLNSAINQEYIRAEKAENDIKSSAISKDGFEAIPTSNTLELVYKTLAGEEKTTELPPATTDSAGVMSVEDKRIINNLEDAITKGEKRALRRLFIAAGAVYNDTNKNIVKTTPWAPYVDSAEYKAQWGLDVLTGTVQTFVSSENVTYEYIDANGEWKIITRVGDKLIWDDTKVVHRIGCYYLSGLGHLTDNDMIIIYNNKEGLYKYYHRGNQSYAGKTYYPINNRLMYTEQDIFVYKSSCFQQNNATVILFFKDSYTNSFNGSAPISSSTTFYNCSNLRVVMAVKANSRIYSNNFYNCEKISILVFFGLYNNTDLSLLPIISKGSILFMLEKAAPTSAITITLHPDAYTRLTDDVDIVAALEAQPLITLVSA